MPSHYAHYYFGKEVTRILADDIKTIINTGQHSIDAYMIGLQGPDILAFYRPYTNNRLNKLGREIHHTSGSTFFSSAIRTLTEQEHATPEAYSYLFGCFCHYMLDSACHPLVAKYMRETGMTHAKIEREFDNFILRISGKSPLGLDTSILLPENEALGAIIAPFYRGTTPGKINAGISSMSRLLGIMCSRRKRTRNNLYAALSRVPVESVRNKRDMIVSTKKAPLADISNAKLWDELNRCVSDTAQEMDAFLDAVLLGKPLSSRLAADYLGHREP